MGKQLIRIIPTLGIILAIVSCTNTKNQEVEPQYLLASEQMVDVHDFYRGKRCLQYDSLDRLYSYYVIDYSEERKLMGMDSIDCIDHFEYKRDTIWVNPDTMPPFAYYHIVDGRIVSAETFHEDHGWDRYNFDTIAYDSNGYLKMIDGSKVKPVYYEWTDGNLTKMYSVADTTYIYYSDYPYSGWLPMDLIRPMFRDGLMGHLPKNMPDSISTHYPDYSWHDNYGLKYTYTFENGLITSVRCHHTVYKTGEEGEYGYMLEWTEKK